jgi:hypothetical protein
VNAFNGRNAFVSALRPHSSQQRLRQMRKLRVNLAARGDPTGFNCDVTQLNNLRVHDYIPFVDNVNRTSLLSRQRGDLAPGADTMSTGRV